MKIENMNEILRGVTMKHSGNDVKNIRLLIDKLNCIENGDYDSLITVLDALDSWTNLQSIRLIEDALRYYINYQSKNGQGECHE